MPSTLRKRDKYYHYDSNTRNDRIRLSLRTSNYKVALREKKRLDELYAKPGPWERPRYSAPVNKAIDSHLRWLDVTKSKEWANRQRQILEKFLHHNVKTYMHEITAADIEDYIILQLRLGLRPNTIKKELHVLKVLWDRALRDGWVDKDIVATIKAPRDTSPQKIRPFTKDTGGPEK